MKLIILKEFYRKLTNSSHLKTNIDGIFKITYINMQFRLPKISLKSKNLYEVQKIHATKALNRAKDLRKKSRKRKNRKKKLSKR